MKSAFGVRIFALLLITTAVNFVAIPASVATSPATINLSGSSSFAVLAGGYAVTGAPSTFNGNIGAGGYVTTGANNVINGSITSGTATTTGASSSINGSIYSGAAITNGAGTTVSGTQYLNGTADLFAKALSQI